MLILRKIGALTSKPYAFNARPWELKSVNSFDILDSFGSSIRLDYRDKEILRIVPRNSEWISDKVRFFYDGFKYKRFHYIYLRKKEAWLKLSLSQLFFFFKLLGCYFSFNEISFRFGDGVDLETIFSVKAISSYLFAKGMNSLINYEKKGSFRATTRSFFFKKTLFSKTDCIFLIGTNLRLENPILNAILRKQVLESSNLKVFVLGSSVSYNYYVKQLGNSLNILYSILQGKHKLSFVLHKARAPVFLFGNSFFLRSDSNYIFDLACNLKKKELLVLYLVHSTGILGGLELGVDFFLSGKKFFSDLSINYHVLTFDNFTTNNSSDFLIYQSSNFGGPALFADLIIPESVFIEKETMYLTFNSSVRETKKIYNSPKQAQEGWFFLQYFFFFFHKLSLGDEKMLVNGNLNMLKPEIRSRLYKRTLCVIPDTLTKLVDPILEKRIQLTILSNIVNLYYNTNVLTSASLNLNVRAHIEETTFVNFENKNGAF